MKPEHLKALKAVGKLEEAGEHVKKALELLSSFLVRLPEPTSGHLSSMGLKQNIISAITRLSRAEELITSAREKLRPREYTVELPDGGSFQDIGATALIHPKEANDFVIAQPPHNGEEVEEEEAEEEEEPEAMPYCPLRAIAFITAEIGSYPSCIGENCAWWDEQSLTCAIKAIAQKPAYACDGGVDERTKALFAALYAKDPELARKLVQEIWEKLKPRGEKNES